MRRIIPRDFGTSLFYRGLSTADKSTFPGMTRAAGQPFSAFIWVKTQAQGVGTNRSFFGQRSGTDLWKMQIGNSGNGNFIAEYSPVNGGGVVDSGVKIQDNKWHFVGFTYDGTKLRSYVDGIFRVQTASTLTNARISSTNGQIGCVEDECLKGFIDSPRIWETALTDEQVADLYYKGPSSVVAAQRVYRFNEASGTVLVDDSGNGANGLVGNGVYSNDVAYKLRSVSNLRPMLRDFKTALSFNGTNSYVRRAIPFITNTSPGMTIEAWLKIPSATRGQDQFVLGNGLHNTLEGMTMRRFTDNRMYFYHANANMSIAPIYDQWTHYVFVVQKGVRMDCYENGVQKGFGTAVPSATLARGDLFIGGSTDVGRYFGGFVNGVRVYDYALNATQIADLFRKNQLPSTPGLEWNLNDGAGNIAKDTSGNTLDGTIVGAEFIRDVPMNLRKSINANLVRNGDFEFVPPYFAATNANARWVDGTAAGSATNGNFGWRLHKGGTAEALYDIGSSYDGSTALKLSTLAVASFTELKGDAVGYDTNKIDGFEMLPNTQYRLKFMMKTEKISGDSGSGAFVHVNMANAAGSNTQELGTPAVKTTTPWTEYVMDFTTGATIRRGHIELGIYGHTGPSTLIMNAWFDSVSLSPVIPVNRILIP